MSGLFEKRTLVAVHKYAVFPRISCLPVGPG